MREIDKNGDGCLDLEEFTLLAEDLMGADFKTTLKAKEN